MADWLTSDVAHTISRFLDCKAYARFFSVCKLTKNALSKDYASVLHPHALIHMTHLIQEARLNTVDELFKFQTLWHGPTMVYVCQVTDDDMDKAYFRIDIIKDDLTNLGNIQISVNHRSFTLDTHDDLVSFPTGFSKALIVPSLENPLKTGTIHSMGYVISDTRYIVHQFYKTEEYNDGFRTILNKLACEICPLAQDRGISSEE
jgi:hypothetical protein